MQNDLKLKYITYQKIIKNYNNMINAKQCYDQATDFDIK